MFSIFNRQFRWQWAQHATPNQHCSGERGFVSPVLSKIGGRLPKSFFQTGFTSCQPQDQRRRFRSLVFFRLLWATPPPNRCQDLQLALPQLSITPPVQPGAAPCVRHISIMVPWYYVVRAAGLASAPSSVHGKRNNRSVFLWSLPSRWAIDGEFKLGQLTFPASVNLGQLVLEASKPLQRSVVRPHREALPQLKVFHSPHNRQGGLSP